MTLETPLYLQAVTGDSPLAYSAQQERALFDVMSYLPGVTLKNDLLVTQRAAGANRSVDVAAGSAIIAGGSIAYQGKYLCRSTATVNVPLAAYPGSGTRTDLIVAQVYDRQADGGTQYGWAPVAVTGTVGGGVPATPASAIPLAQITMAAGDTSVGTAEIKDVRTLNTLGDVPLWQLTGGNGQAIANATNVPYTGWTVSDWVGVDSTSNFGEFAVRIPGRYALTWNTRFTLVNTGTGGVIASERGAYIIQVRNGTTLGRPASDNKFPAAQGPRGQVVTCTGTARAQAGDSFRAFLYQSSGQQLNIDDVFGETSFTGVWVGP